MKTLLTLALAACTLASAAEVDRRQAAQQDRIGHGVQSGQLTPKEAAKLERKEVQIHHKIRRERVRNGGTLTPQQRANAERALNKQSTRIEREKHDAQIAK